MLAADINDGRRAVYTQAHGSAFIFRMQPHTRSYGQTFQRGGAARKRKPKDRHPPLGGVRHPHAGKTNQENIQRSICQCISRRRGARLRRSGDFVQSQVGRVDSSPVFVTVA